jgi:hypothetical protein
VQAKVHGADKLAGFWWSVGLSGLEDITIQFGRGPWGFTFVKGCIKSNIHNIVAI